MIHRRDAEAQSFILLLAPAALITKIKFFSAPSRLCGEKFLNLFVM